MCNAGAQTALHIGCVEAGRVEAGRVECGPVETRPVDARHVGWAGTRAHTHTHTYTHTPDGATATHFKPSVPFWVMSEKRASCQVARRSNGIPDFDPF